MRGRDHPGSRRASARHLCHPPLDGRSAAPNRCPYHPVRVDALSGTPATLTAGGSRPTAPNVMSAFAWAALDAAPLSAAAVVCRLSSFTFHATRTPHPPRPRTPAVPLAPGSRPPPNTFLASAPVPCRARRPLPSLLIFLHRHPPSRRNGTNGSLPPPAAVLEPPSSPQPLTGKKGSSSPAVSSASNGEGGSSATARRRQVGARTAAPRSSLRSSDALSEGSHRPFPEGSLPPRSKARPKKAPSSEAPSPPTPAVVASPKGR